MKKKILVAIGLVMMMGCMSACGKEAENVSTPTKEVVAEVNEETNEVADSTSDYVTYEFETYDGESVVIDSTNIVSQESDDNPLESAKVPADAEVIAPGRDYVYLSDASYYYVEDAVNGLVTVANKSMDVASEEDGNNASTNGVYSTDDYSISYIEGAFEVNEVRGFVRMSYCSPDVEFAGSNEIIITKDENVTAEEIAQAIAGDDVDGISDGSVGSQEIPAKLYTRISESPADSTLTLVDSFLVMQSGDDVLTIEVIRTVGQAEEVDMTIEGAFTYTLESFVLN